MSKSVKADFDADWREYLVGALRKEGYAPAATSSTDKLAIQYYGSQWRRVPIRKRSVHRSSPLTCPDELKKGLDALCKKFEHGEDVRPHLSRTLKKPDFDDSMLNDWGVYHFHLGTSIESDGFAARSDPVLFAFVGADDVYFIDCRNHGSWTDDDILPIIHSEWPELLEPFRIVDLVAVAVPTSAADRKALRKAGLNSVIQIGGSDFYAPPGGGYTMDGTSIAVRIRVNAIRGQLRRLARDLDSLAPTIASAIAYVGHKAPNDLHVRLKFSDTAAEVYEASSGVVLGRFDV